MKFGVTKNDYFIFKVHFKIEEISIKLRSGDLGIPQNPEERFGIFTCSISLSASYDMNVSEMALVSVV